MVLKGNNTKAKEPIKLRFKALANGFQSLYLDYYHDGKREYEFLRLYLKPEISSSDKIENEKIIKEANDIKNRRLIGISNGKSVRDDRAGGLLLSEWIKTLIERKNNKVSKSSIKGLSRLRRHLIIYRDDTRLDEVDKRFCMGFTDYLRTARSLKSVNQKEGKKIRFIAQTTQAEMFNALSIVLNEAVREGLIQSNATRRLSNTERIKVPKSTREYLTVEELRILIDTPVDSKALTDKNAFLFCCFCGLRHSDVSALKWNNIIRDGKKMSVSIIQKKTKQPLIVPLSSKAISFLPDQKGKSNEESVFDLPNQSVTNKRLKIWAKDAHIAKNVTFHVSRHTFVFLIVTACSEIYT
ncbi:MAG: site-specific integrase, partial [Muribaculaceae bacterium]|nr:site-specific integrase [Muribaculaceae bacterium]